MFETCCGIAGGVVCSVVLWIVCRIVDRLWFQAASARAARRYPADWEKPGGEEAFFWIETNGKRSFETDLDSAINNAHAASMLRGEWPTTAIVYRLRTGEKTPRVVYGPCDRCERCTYKNSKGECMPCVVAARNHPNDLQAAIKMSRSLADMQLQGIRNVSTGEMIDVLAAPPVEGVRRANEEEESET